MLSSDYLKKNLPLVVWLYIKPSCFLLLSIKLPAASVALIRLRYVLRTVLKMSHFRMHFRNCVCHFTALQTLRPLRTRGGADRSNTLLRLANTTFLWPDGRLFYVVLWATVQANNVTKLLKNSHVNQKIQKSECIWNSWVYRVYRPCRRGTVNQRTPASFFSTHAQKGFERVLCATTLEIGA